MCILEIDNSIVFRQKFQAKDRTLVTYAFSSMVEEISKEMQSCETVVPVPGQVVFLVGDQQDDTCMRSTICFPSFIKV